MTGQPRVNGGRAFVILPGQGGRGISDDDLIAAYRGRPTKEVQDATWSPEYRGERWPISTSRPVSCWHELAQTWLRLARNLEHAQALLKNWGDPKFRKTG